MNSIFEIFENNVLSIFSKIAKQYNCPETIFSIKNNYSSKKKEWEMKIELHELSFPYDENNKIVATTLVLYITPNTDAFELMIRKDRFNKINLPTSASVTEKNKKPLYKFVSFRTDDLSVYQYIKDNLEFCIENYESSHSFGCCSKYKECSDQKKCLHINQLYAKGCQYRSNLESGRIFF